MIGSGQSGSISSCSPLYIRMRNAVVSRPGGNSAGGNSTNGGVPVSELQRRLQNISSSLAKGSVPQGSNQSGYGVPNSASLAHMANPSAAAAAGGGGGYGAGDSNTINQQFVQQAEVDEEALRVPDVLPIRVLELEDTVELRANTDSTYTSTEGRPPNMDLVCGDARVKVFAKHVVAARSDSGAPVAELVLEELFQLSEDEDTNALMFFLGPKPAGDGKTIAASTIVEFKCQSLHQLRCLYKLVSIRRSAIEYLKRQEAH